MKNNKANTGEVYTLYEGGRSHHYLACSLYPTKSVGCLDVTVEFRIIPEASKALFEFLSVIKGRDEDNHSLLRKETVLEGAGKVICGFNRAAGGWNIEDVVREFGADGRHSNKDVSRRRVVEEDLVEEKRLHAFREGSSQEDSLSIQLADFGQHPLVGLFSHRMKSQKLLTLIKDKTLD